MKRKRPRAQIEGRRRMSKRQPKKKMTNDPTIVRLDALIALFVKMNEPKKEEKFNEAVAARILNSAGLTPTEIAIILGKKSRTDITSYLYPRKKSSKTEGEQGEKSAHAGENTR
jgi:hypothetical protein